MDVNCEFEPNSIMIDVHSLRFSCFSNYMFLIVYEYQSQCSWISLVCENIKIKNIEDGETRTPSLLIWSQTRYRYATPPKLLTFNGIALYPQINVALCNLILIVLNYTYNTHRLHEFSCPRCVPLALQTERTRQHSFPSANLVEQVDCTDYSDSLATQEVVVVVAMVLDTSEQRLHHRSRVCCDLPDWELRPHSSRLPTGPSTELWRCGTRRRKQW